MTGRGSGSWVPSGSGGSWHTIPRHRHPVAWTLLALTVVGFCLMLAPAATFGVLSMLLVLASPLVACWWCAFPRDDPTTGST